MWDSGVKKIGLTMHHPNLSAVSALELPYPYSIRGYQPGDEHHWAQIEMAAGEFTRHEQGLAAFEKDFGCDRAQLPERMLFLVDGVGVPVGTATAWFHEGIGRLHWVAIHGLHQSRGLSRPLVSIAMARMVELGHREAMLATQTPSWVAIKVYLSLGWLPEDTGLADHQEGWAIVREKLGNIPLHP